MPMIRTADGYDIAISTSLQQQTAAALGLTEADVLDVLRHARLRRDTGPTFYTLVSRFGDETYRVRAGRQRPRNYRDRRLRFIVRGLERMPDDELDLERKPISGRATINWHSRRYLVTESGLRGLSGKRGVYVIERGGAPIYVGKTESGLFERFDCRLKTLREFAISRRPYRLRFGEIKAASKIHMAEAVLIRRVIRHNAQRLVERLQKKQPGMSQSQREKMFEKLLEKPFAVIRNRTSHTAFSTSGRVTLIHTGSPPAYVRGEGGVNLTIPANTQYEQEAARGYSPTLIDEIVSEVFA